MTLPPGRRTPLLHSLFSQFNRPQASTIGARRVKIISAAKLIAQRIYVPVAQLDRASDSDSEGRRFESCRAYHGVASCAQSRADVHKLYVCSFLCSAAPPLQFACFARKLPYAPHGHDFLVQGQEQSHVSILSALNTASARARRRKLRLKIGTGRTKTVSSYSDFRFVAPPLPHACSSRARGRMLRMVMI